MEYFRLLFAGARNGHMPLVLGTLHVKFFTPWAALLVMVRFHSFVNLYVYLFIHLFTPSFKSLLWIIHQFILIETFINHYNLTTLHLTPGTTCLFHSHLSQKLSCHSVLILYQSNNIKANSPILMPWYPLTKLLGGESAIRVKWLGYPPVINAIWNWNSL